MQRIITKNDIHDGAIIAVDKPAGITSFDVIRKLRAISGIKKMGHAGTLDPFATGLLIVAVGSATKRLHEFLKLPKSYEAVIRFGVQTDTGDRDGQVIAKGEVTFSSGELEKAITAIIGTHEIAVPIYSAIKRAGKPLYEYARRGHSIEIPKRRMQVNDAKLLGWNPETKTAQVLFVVESGVYIRSLGEELARRLGTVAHVTELRRVLVGGFTINDALSL